MTQPDQYCVIGNPIEHSRSPQIHRAFARAHGQSLRYSKLLAPLDGFERAVRTFIEQGGCGMNVTVPFKEQAFALADHCSERVAMARAANTLSVGPDGIHADNTDGVGLVCDLSVRHHIALAGTDIVLLGAGGAARGVLLPLIQAGVARILIANRTHQRAVELGHLFDEYARRANVELRTCEMGQLALETKRFTDAVWINATAAGLGSGASPVEGSLLSEARIAYDMVYANQPTAFMAAAAAAGCTHVVDGLGMLVEQAAESFLIWRGVRPTTDAVYAQLR